VLANPKLATNQLDQEFEPLRMQNALCQKKYMRRIKKQSMRMEELIKKLRAAPRNSDRRQLQHSDSDMHEDSHTETSSRGDADYTLFDRVVH
jgi:hypothetical protein